MKKEDILANCIEEILAGKCTLEDCLAKYPNLSDELRPLLEIATGIQPERVTPTPEFKQRARNHLLEVMQPAAPATEHRGPGIFGWLKPLAPARAFPLVVALVILAVLAAGSTTVVYASQGSLPDDVLYPVKTGVENLRLTFTWSPEARASLHLKLAQRRIGEVIAQSNLGRDISTSALEAIAIQIDAAVKEIDSTLAEDTKTLLSQLSELTVNQQMTLGQLLEAAPEATQPALKQALDATRRGNLIAQVAYGNPTFLSIFPSVLDEELEAAHFKLEGALLSAEGGTWNIGGLLIENVNSPPGIPPIGSRVEIEGVVYGDEIFVSEIDREGGVDNQVKIEGIFGGTSSDGTIWYVGGIPISKPQGIMPPPEGSQLKLVGIIQNGIFTVIEMESEDAEEEKEEAKKVAIEVSGVLVEVHSGEKIIVIEVAGAQVTVNISEAVIMDEDRQPLTFSDLESLVGEDIEADGLYLKDGHFFAKGVYVDIEQEQGQANEEDALDEELEHNESEEEGEEEEGED